MINQDLVTDYLQFLPPRSGVYYLTPWIWAILVTCFGQLKLEEVTVGQSCMFLTYLLEAWHHPEKFQTSVLEGQRPHGKKPSCLVWSHSRWNYSQLIPKHLRKPIIDEQFCVEKTVCKRYEPSILPTADSKYMSSSVNIELHSWSH